MRRRDENGLFEAVLPGSVDDEAPDYRLRVTYAGGYTDIGEEIPSRNFARG